MIRKQFELREMANHAKYIEHDREACTNVIMELYNYIPDARELYKRIPDAEKLYKNFYRYRQLNDYELNNLKDETIFMRWPSTYEDEGDCTPVFDLKELTNYILRTKYPCLVRNRQQRCPISYDDIKRHPRFEEAIDKFRDMQLITCFTETHNDKKMWNKYANDGTGICLVYNSLKLLDCVLSKGDVMNFMPVRYVEGREQCKDIMMNHYDLLEDRDETIDKYRLTVMTKEKFKFSFEREWRLIFEKMKDETSGENGESIPFINPWCIICGPNTDRASAQYKELEEIAIDKGIKLI